ncbi:MAG: 23S rRNA (guanosine(2251)-2'-O)-methyltransferase RlmB [Clostridia bacterium]|nr:23S rRNA (guanosine(2251)-2'-O)-methyltransferase RlmB [Clostridia bacterium]
MNIYGKNAIAEALDSVTINKLFIDKNMPFDKYNQKIIDDAKRKNVKVYFESKNVLSQKCGSVKHQGFVAEITEFVYSETEDILKIAESKNEQPFILVLDGITDPQNLGAIIRSAECFGVHGIIIQKDRACSINETVYKTSAGAINNMLIARVVNLNREIEYLKKNNVWIYGVELGGEELSKTKLDGALALVIGSEGKGIRQLVKENCDFVVSIPMKGAINSLNASVATGIALYEVTRQKAS